MEAFVLRDRDRPRSGHGDGDRRGNPIVVEPPGGGDAFDLHEIWIYHELLYFLTWRDVKVRYKQTVIGASWAILQPVLTMVAFSVIFGRFVGVPSDGVPYPVFSYTALLPWTFVASAVARSSTSLVSSANLISKVYFPRLLVPTSAVLALTVDFGAAFVVLIGMMAFYSLVPGPACLTLPLFLLLALLTALGLGLWLSALNVRYRDVTQLVPFLIQFWLFVTPVAYPISVAPEPWHTLLGLNPMAGVVEGFRWALLGAPPPGAGFMLLSITAAITVFAIGLLYCGHVQDELADLV
jgi:lipopolysaccharide transport system permease protein